MTATPKLLDDEREALEWLDKEVGNEDCSQLAVLRDHIRRLNSILADRESAGAAAWIYEYHDGYVWETSTSEDRPVDDDWHRNIRPLFLHPLPESALRALVEAADGVLLSMVTRDEAIRELRAALAQPELRKFMEGG